MANCDITKGRLGLECKNAVSGFKRIVLANYLSDSGFTYASDVAEAQEMTSIGNIAEVFEYETKNTGNSFAQTVTSNRDNGTTIWTQVMTFILTKIDKEIEFQLKMAAWGRPFVFVQLMTNEWIILGSENGCEFSGQSGVAGAMDGLNGYTVTATAIERNPIYFLSSTAVTELEALLNA